MTLLLIIYGGPRSELVPALLNQYQVRGWTQLGQAHGVGRSGRRSGSRAWPGESQVYFTVVAKPLVGRLSAALREKKVDAIPGESIHIAVLPVERFF
jgi:hypothetical protein